MVASWPPAAIGYGFGYRRSGGLLLAMPGRSHRERCERRLLGARGRGGQKLRGGDSLNGNPRPKVREKYLEGDPASLTSINSRLMLAWVDEWVVRSDR